MKKKGVAHVVAVFVLCFLWGLGFLPVTASASNGAPGVWNPGKEIISLTLDVRSGDITDTFQDALNMARKDKSHAYEITVPAGTYKVSEGLHIFSNTKLNMEGVTIRFTAKEGNILVTGTSIINSLKDTSYSKVTGYGGYENIYINKGTWVANPKNGSSVMRFFHGRNIVLDGMTVDNCGGRHQVEVCALDGFYVKGCTFKNYSRKKSGSSKFEALQLDIPCADSVYKGVHEDGTMMRNVYVEGCTFSKVPRGVGTHTQLVGSYHENVYIRNNTFTNVAEEAIVALNYYNCEISGNKIENCGAGVLVQTMKKNSSTVYAFTEDVKYKKAKNFHSDLKTRVVNNTITVKYTKESDEVQGVKIYGRKLSKAEKGAKGKKIPARDYYAGGVVVSGNIIQTAGHGMHLMDAKKCVITNNQITGKGFNKKDPRVKQKKYDGIFLEKASTSNSISNNNIKSAVRNGIFVYEKSSVKDLSNNVIASSGKYGIGIGNKSKSTGAFTKNTINKSKSSGIFISESSTVKSIIENTITSSGGHGIGLWKKCKVTGAIEKNIITKSGDKGISLSTGCNVASIVNNKITTAKKNGIFIYNKSKAKKIKGNSIKGTKKPAIKK